MRTLTKNEYELLERLIMMKEDDLNKFLVGFLKAKYKEVIHNHDYIYSVGNIPIVLVAHMDTVFKTPPTELYYDTKKNVLWTPTGAGFDDRAGIFSIIQIIKAGFRPHIVFTSGEETGGLGAQSLSKIECPFKDIRFVIQLDRRGTADCVFYDCDNEDFTKYIEGFGFVEAIGSFTDICWLCPEWKVAGVNFSVGYMSEHSSSETLHVAPLLATIKKTIKILNQPVKDIPKFDYIPSKYAYDWKNEFYGYGKYGYGYDGSYAYGAGYYDSAYDYSTYSRLTQGEDICDGCYKYTDPQDLLEVQMKDGSIGYFCLDCVEKKADFCVICGKAYEIDKNEPGETLCPDCRMKEEAYKKVW